MNDSGLSHDLHAHIQACESVRRITLWSMISLAAINAVVVVFVTAQTFTIKGRQDRVLAWIESAEHTRDTDMRLIGERISAVVAANVQREVTFGDRFRSIDQSISELRQLVFALHEKPTIGNTYMEPSPRKPEPPASGGVQEKIE